MCDVVYYTQTTILHILIIRQYERIFQEYVRGKLYPLLKQYLSPFPLIIEYISATI